jgi:hypothetical protein
MPEFVEFPAQSRAGFGGGDERFGILGRISSLFDDNRSGKSRIAPKERSDIVSLPEYVAGKAEAASGVPVDQSDERTIPGQPHPVGKIGIFPVGCASAFQTVEQEFSGGAV